MIEGLPNWVQWVGGVIGVAIAVTVSRLGQAVGAKVRSNGTSSSHVELAGALVDSASVDRLTAALEAQTVEVLAAKQKNADIARMLCQAIKSHEEAVEDMTKEMIRRR